MITLHFFIIYYFIIILTKGKILINEKVINKRAISNVMKYKWTMPIEYYVDNSLNSTLVNIALNDISKNTCIRFKQLSYPPTGTGLVYYRGTGCTSFVGRVYQNNSQNVSLGFGCSWNGVIQHETGHALGLFHEQSRPDRDSFVSINISNAIPGTEDNFLQNPLNSSITFNISYDYGSTMHYGKDAFSRNSLDTIIPKNPLFKSVLGQYGEMSFNDFKIINYYYCNNTCNGTSITCLYGGYQDPNNCSICKCPHGYGGINCSNVAISDTNCSPSTLIATNQPKILTDFGIKNCFYRIKTDSNNKISIIVNSTNVYYYNPCWIGIGLEVKFLKDKTVTGAMFCGQVNVTNIITEDSEAMINYIGWYDVHNFTIIYQKL
ncbi:Astacin-like metalloendopeptidase [Strongyloides ratti]|uniref:Zinc metalloproteinase n=1 Tax=Strongyloides ratti TaxID=34506 RepID=A0A090LQM4_STRRB|nr:Astacin-like metalloendopeptidase [Strongyloides ratti]CEF70481.1 Astacin-like metalloendopeptidase [Strongyloides ratti]